MKAKRIKKDVEYNSHILLIQIENYAVTLENNLVVSNM